MNFKILQPMGRYSMTMIRRERSRRYWQQMAQIARKSSTCRRRQRFYQRQESGLDYLSPETLLDRFTSWLQEWANRCETCFPANELRLPRVQSMIQHLKLVAAAYEPDPQQQATSLTPPAGMAGLYTQGTVFDSSDLNQIVKGKTTTTDLMTILGTPYSRTPGADGGEQWFYYRSNNSDVVGGVPNLMIEKSERKRKNLTVYVDKNKVVVDYTLSNGPVVTTTTEIRRDEQS